MIDFLLRGGPRRKFSRLRFLLVKSIWNPRGINQNEHLEMALLVATLRDLKDPSFQRKYFLFLKEIKVFTAKLEINSSQWGKRPCLLIDRFILDSILPGNPNEAFGILGSPELNQSLLLSKKIVRQRSRPKRRIGVGVRDKGQRDLSSTSASLILKELQSSVQIESERLDYRDTEPIIFPDGF